MEGCQKLLLSQRVNLLFWSIFSLSEGPQAAGYDGARGTQPATFLLVLHPPAQPLPETCGSPETETQTSSYCFNAGTQEGSALALKHCLEKPWQAGKGLTNTQFKAGIVTPPSQLPAARHISCCAVPFQKPLHVQIPALEGKWDVGRDVPHSPSTAHPEQGWQAQNSSPLAEPSTSTLSPQPLLQLDSNPEQALREGSIPLCLA